MSIADTLADKIWEVLQKAVARFQELEKTKQKNVILGTVTLMLGIGLFFYAFVDASAFTKKSLAKGPVAPEVLDPLDRIGKGIAAAKCQMPSSDCAELEKDKNESLNKIKIAKLVGSHPIAQMTAHIAKRDPRVAAYLVAIAKKESSWGKHTPKKNGRECYNYWGYRGKENTTDSGYSCFDNPEHAVKVVGDRIEKLVNQRIDTPAKMVVWKCGRDCEAAGGQAAANKWIADVGHVYNKLEN